MPAIRAYGITAGVPGGFEGRIFRRPAVGGAVPYPVVHVASFPLPDGVADFGGGVVDRMGPEDVFVVLFEYGPESLGTALFSRQGLPGPLPPSAFSTILLRRGIPGQAGTQQFFTEAGRPFTLYAVIGSSALRSVTVPKVNRVLRGLAVGPSSASPPTAGPAASPTADSTQAPAAAGAWN